MPKGGDMGEDSTRPAPVRPGEADSNLDEVHINLDEVRRRISRLTQSRLRGGLNESEEKDYDDLTRRELELVERLN